jgi:hypothetical protein
MTKDPEKSVGKPTVEQASASKPVQQQSSGTATQKPVENPHFTPENHDGESGISV